jgi:hypothetical protein
MTRHRHNIVRMAHTRFYLTDDLPRLTGAVRMDVFATRTIGRGKRARLQGAAWQGWNPDPALETAHARLPGAGSFYWHGAIQAAAAARRMLRDDPTIHQIKLETISGREIGRFYR